MSEFSDTVLYNYSTSDSKQVIQLCSHQDKLFALRADGRIFYRELDGRHVNTDGRTPYKFQWIEVALPV